MKSIHATSCYDHATSGFDQALKIHTQALSLGRGSEGSACKPVGTRPNPLKLLRRLALLLTRGMVAAAMATASLTVSAQAGIATWNLGWLMDAKTHARWAKGCQAIGWQTEDELKKQGKALPAELAGLPYCDVHDGIDFTRKQACAQAMGPVLKNRPNNLDSADAKCRVSPDLADWQQYEIKLRTLKEPFAAMDKDGVTLIGLQEVFGDEAVRQILPPGWDARTSATLADAPRIPQHVGLAWKTSAHTPRDFKPVMALSAIGTRPLRPGMQFTLDIASKPVDGLVVHLKAGCRSPQLDKPNRPSEKDACPILAQQVPVIEQWIDDRVGRDFVLIGDFNRTLLKELEQFPQPDSARFGRTPAGQAQWVAPEWNDNQPQGSIVIVVPHVTKTNGTLVAGDFFCAQTTGIDHVILSPSLLQRMKPDKQQFELVPAGYKLNGKRLPVGKTTVPPSDHCARFIRLTPKS